MLQENGICLNDNAEISRPISNALLMPLEGDVNRFTSGVFNSTGEFVEGSMLSRNNFPAVPLPAVEKLNGTYAFGGYLFRHYGHFLLESLSRAYAIQTLSKKIPILFMSTHNELNVKYSNIFKILNIQNEIKIIHIPTEVDLLLFSDEGCCLNSNYNNISDIQLKALAKYNPQPPTETRLVWLSRSYLSLLGGVNNENEVEHMLQKIDFEIVYPERLSIIEQLEIVSKAKIVAGFSGSAFFTALLSKHIYGNFHIFARTSSIARPITLFLEAKGVNISKYYPKLHYSSGGGPRTRTYLDNPKEIVTALLKTILS